MERYADGKPIEFSIQFCKKSTGELITYERAVLTSFHSSGSTINVPVSYTHLTLPTILRV